MMNTYMKTNLGGTYTIGVEHPQMGNIELTMTAPKTVTEEEMDAVEKILRRHYAEIIKETRRLRRC